jgi:hypothetical protein
MLINNNGEKMKVKRNFHTDPGHGWLEVKYSELKDLGIEDKISSYSYIKDDVVYLEEDCDAAVYLDAMKAKGKEVEIIELIQLDNYHEIRQYKSYDMINHPVQFEDVLKKEIEKRGFDTSKIKIAVIR